MAEPRTTPQALDGVRVLELVLCLTNRFAKMRRIFRCRQGTSVGVPGSRTVPRPRRGVTRVRHVCYIRERGVSVRSCGDASAKAGGVSGYCLIKIGSASAFTDSVTARPVSCTAGCSVQSTSKEQSNGN